MPGKFLDSKVKDKGFFFWAQEWQRQLVPHGPRQVRVPTAAEVGGDFSATTGPTVGSAVIVIKDPLDGFAIPWQPHSA
jgi:hypothetical protein